MPAIKAYKQITVRQSLKTDRCYILLDDLSINVKSCATQRNSDIKERASQEKEMEEQYKKAVKSMDALTQTLAEIK